MKKEKKAKRGKKDKRHRDKKLDPNRDNEDLSSDPFSASEWT